MQLYTRHKTKRLLNNGIDNEQELLSRVAEGDEAAFGILFRAVSPALKNHLQKVIRDPDGLLDVLQETFIKIWLYRDRLPSITHLMAYLKKIAANEAFTYLGKQDMLQLTLKSTKETVLLNPAEESLAYKETFQVVQEAIRSLPEQRRVIYQMSRIDGLKATEIARKLSLSHSYVRNSICQAQRDIRQKLILAGKLFISLWHFFLSGAVLFV